MSDCIGKPCDQVGWSASDPAAEVWQDHLLDPTGNVRRYPMPQEDDPLYSLLQFPQMRQAFDLKAREEMERLSIEGQHCAEGCRCVTTDQFIYTDDRVSLEMDYDAGSGATWKIIGSYRLEMWRNPGTCYPVRKKISHLKPIDEEVYALMESVADCESQEKG